MEKVDSDFGKVDKLFYTLFPSVENDLDANLVSPYNFVLNYRTLINDATTVVGFSNHQLKRHCQRFGKIEDPGLKEMNDLLIDSFNQIYMEKGLSTGESRSRFINMKRYHCTNLFTMQYFDIDHEFANDS